MTPRKLIASLLEGQPVEALLAEVRRHPPRKALSPLIAALCHRDDRIKWHAVSALGVVTAALAEEDMEAARSVMRRLMWSLNDESGSVGWGAPEALGEIMANHEGLAVEYAYVLVACMREDGFYLELTALQRGLMWGIGRLAGTGLDLLRKGEAPALLLPYLASGDPEVRGLAVRALGMLRAGGAKGRITTLTNDPAELSLYERGELHTTTVGRLAGEALALLVRDSLTDMTPVEEATKEGMKHGNGDGNTIGGRHPAEDPRTEEGV